MKPESHAVGLHRQPCRLDEGRSASRALLPGPGRRAPRTHHRKLGGPNHFTQPKGLGVTADYGAAPGAFFPPRQFAATPLGACASPVAPSPIKKPFSFGGVLLRFPALGSRSRTL